MDKKILEKYQSQCARKECCVSEIRRKLQKDCEGNTDHADEIIEALQSDGFLDDGRYASAFARDKAYFDGWGPIKIRFQLASKFIDKTLINKAISEIDKEKAEIKMRSVLQSKYKSVKDEKDAKLRLLKFALSRGYEYDDISGIVEEILTQQ